MNNKFVSYYIVFLVVLIIILYFNNKSNEVIFVESHIDNNKYLVRNEPDKLEAANLLANIVIKIKKLIKYLENKYPKSDFVKRLKNNFNPDSINESSYDNKYTSYSINKGEKIVLCLRSRDSKNKLIDENTLMFVALHEITHIGTKSINHTEEFWINFKFVLKNAVNIKIYDYHNYNESPIAYCGIKITDQPLDDNNIKDKQL